jgi:hypothetical protein
MLVRNLVAAIWFLMGAGWGYWGYKLLARRYGHRAFGRFAANWAMMTGWFAGLAGFALLWNGGRGGGGWSRGRYVEPYQWEWPAALAFALVGGLATGGLLTWARQPSSYAFDVPSSTPFIDEEDVREILESEARGGPEACRQLAESLVKESRARRQPLPRELELFVGRHLSRRQT